MHVQRMHAILVFRPEAADAVDPPDPSSDPFSGIEVYQTWLDEEIAQDVMLGVVRDHPEWHAMLVALPPASDGS